MIKFDDCLISISNYNQFSLSYPSVCKHTSGGDRSVPRGEHSNSNYITFKRAAVKKFRGLFVYVRFDLRVKNLVLIYLLNN